MTAEVTRQYRYNSFPFGAELEFPVTGLKDWTESMWADMAENDMANMVRDPEYWVFIDFEGED